MKIKSIWLKDEGGGRLAPKTLISQVFNNRGKSLEKILEELKARVGADSGEAKVGQHLIVEEVDRKGNPIKWRFVDVEEFEQIQADYGQTDSTKPDYIKNKPTIPSIANLVKNTDYATSSKAGLVRTTTSYGTKMSGQYLQTNKALNSEIDSRSHQYNPIVPYNLDYAVKKSLSACKTSWTDDEKQKARDLLGIKESTGGDISEYYLHVEMPDGATGHYNHGERVIQEGRSSLIDLVNACRSGKRIVVVDRSIYAESEQRGYIPVSFYDSYVKLVKIDTDRMENNLIFESYVISDGDSFYHSYKVAISSNIPQY